MVKELHSPKLGASCGISPVTLQSLFQLQQNDPTTNNPQSELKVHM